MQKSGDAAAERPMIKLGIEEDLEVDEALAPFVADILTETHLDLMHSRVMTRSKSGELAAEFIFGDSDEAGEFLSMLGTVWEEQQPKLRGLTGEVGFLEGWGLAPVTFEAEAYQRIVDEEGEPVLDEDGEEQVKPCECGTWHVVIGVAVAVPLNTVDEFAKRFRSYITEDEDQPDFLAEFEGIAGLEEFL